MERPTCGTCVFFDGKLMECHAQPPANSTGNFPHVNRDNWCGAHQDVSRYVEHVRNNPSEFGAPDRREPTTERASVESCDHCWHRTGMSLTSMPPLLGFICCHCGATEYKQQKSEPTFGHGKFLPTATGSPNA